jgi:hypothetical protein
VELYDKGNLILADKDLQIINVLRPRVQGEEKFLVRETYSFEVVNLFLILLKLEPGLKRLLATALF